MLLTYNNCPTSEATPENIVKLKAAKSVTTYEEAGWFCAAGYDANDNRIVHVHFSSRDARDAVLNPNRAMINGQRFGLRYR